MKLYATVTSERASKGQGGNSYIRIELSGEHGFPIGSLVLDTGYSQGEEYVLTYCREGGELVEVDRVPKGEKQKGEHCDECEREMTAAKHKRNKGLCDTCIDSMQ